MGEAKRRKQALGDKYGRTNTIVPWLGISQQRAEQIYRWTMRGTWIGIGVMVALWVTIRFIGPAFGWWQLSA